MIIINKLLFSIIFLVLVQISTNVWAVPNLGVGTDGSYYLENSGDTLQDYQSYFGVSAVYNGEYHGFGIDSSGTTLYVWTNDSDTDVWLLAENSYNDNNLSFDGNVFVDTSGLGIDQSVASYDSSYWGVNLGNPTDSSGNWSALPNDPFANGSFYVYTGTLTYSLLTDEDFGNYLFAYADYEGDGSIGGGEFSPKTTGAVIIINPEPATLVLLGIGLAGLAGVGARCKWKKKAVGKS